MSNSCPCCGCKVGAHDIVCGECGLPLEDADIDAKDALFSPPCYGLIYVEIDSASSDLVDCAESFLKNKWRSIWEQNLSTIFPIFSPIIFLDGRASVLATSTVYQRISDDVQVSKYRDILKLKFEPDS
jgi:hypothetical protein